MGGRRHLTISSPPYSSNRLLSENLITYGIHLKYPAVATFKSGGLMNLSRLEEFNSKDLLVFEVGFRHEESSLF